MEMKPTNGAEAPENPEYYRIPYFFLIRDAVRNRMAELAEVGELPTTERELTTLQHWLTTDIIADMLPLSLMDTQTFHFMQRTQIAE